MVSSHTDMVFWQIPGGERNVVNEFKNKGSLSLLKVQVLQENLQGPRGKGMKMRRVNILDMGCSNFGCLVGQ